MRIAIFGAGGLGGYYGARLAAAGHDVAFIARGAHLAAIRERGLRVESPAGDLLIDDALATDDPGEVGPVDAVLVAVKTWQIPDAARAMQAMVGDSTLVVPFLNGVEAPDGLAAGLGAGNVLGGLSRVFSLVESPGVIRHFSPGAPTEIGELDGTDSERARALCETLTAAGIEASVSPDIRTALWRKLVMVSSWTGISAATRSPMGVLRGVDAVRALVDRSIDEGVAVAAAVGHPLEDGFKSWLWSFYEDLPASATASMQRDILAGKPSELEAWNGAIVRFGAERSVDTPVHAFTYATLLPMELRARGELAEG